MKITAITDSGETIRISLPTPTWEGRTPYGTGITLVTIYVSPRARRCVIETDSIWDAGNGQCQGTQYQLIDDADALNSLASEYPAVALALENAGLITSEAL